MRTLASSLVSPWRKNILFRLYVSVVLAVMLGTGLYSLYVMQSLRNDAENRLQEQLVHLSTVLSESLARPLFDINNAAISGVVNAVGATPDVIRLRVVAPDGTLLAQSGSAHLNPVESVSTSRPIELVELGRTYALGHIELALSRNALEQGLRAQIFRTVIANLLMTLVIIGSIFLVGRKIARPFADIQDALGKLSHGDTNIHLSGAGRQDQIGQLSDAVRSFRDTITKLRQAEQDTAALLQEKSGMLDKLHAIFEGSNDAIMLLTQKGFFDCNQRTLDMFGIPTRLEFVACHPLDFSPPLQPDGRDSVSAANEKIQQAFERGESRFEWVYIHRDGSPFPAEVLLSAFDYGGEIVLQATVRDITERKKIEQALRELNEDLEAKIAARTQELTRTMQMAEAANTAKGDFLANMSHEIRTPMNAIIGMAHLALRTELNPKQRDYVDKIHRAGLSLLGILNDILDFSKIEAGKLDIETVAFSLDEVLANVASVTSQTAAAKHLEYLFRVPPAVPSHLMGDPLRLGQILINLVNNAIKFTERGEIEVACLLRAQTESHATVQFSVRDTGIGMSPEQQAKLFQPFSQADGSTTRKYGGTGLGLSISQRLVALMGGHIGVSSTAGSGACFQFCLDLPLAPSPGRESAAPSSLAGSRALVVDDHPISREILVETLQAWSSRVEALAAGAPALAAIRAADAAQDPYHWVLVDYQMPGLDGLEFARSLLRDTPLACRPALVLLTAFGQEEVQEAALALKVNAVLCKPVSRSLLRDVLVPPGAPPAPAEAVPDTAQHPEQLPRVLLAEDNDINQMIAVELMETMGVVVDIANNGQEAIDMLQATSPATYGLILMDLQMPVMDGHAATRLIRQDTRYAGLPIVAMTAHALADIRERALKEGMQGYLTKPIDPDQLFATLSHWLDIPIPSAKPTPSGSDSPQAG